MNKISNTVAALLVLAIMLVLSWQPDEPRKTVFFQSRPTAEALADPTAPTAMRVLVTEDALKKVAPCINQVRVATAGWSDKFLPAKGGEVLTYYTPNGQTQEVMVYGEYRLPNGQVQVVAIGHRTIVGGLTLIIVDDFRQVGTCQTATNQSNF